MHLESTFLELAKGRKWLLYFLFATFSISLATASFAKDAAQKPIRIGVSLGLSGTYAGPASMQERGYRLWESEVNKRQLLNRPVEVIIRDDKSSKDKAIEIYKELISAEKVDLVFGPYSSAIAAAVAPIIDENGYPTVFPGAAADHIWKQGYKNIFGLFIPASKYTLEMLRLAVLSELNRVAIVFADDGFSKEVAAGARKWARSAGRKVVLYEEFKKGRHNLISLARSVHAAEAELLITAGHFDESVDMRRALLSIDWYPRAYFATIGPTLQKYHEVLGEDAELTFAASLWEPDEKLEFPGSNSLIERFKHTYKMIPSYHAANAYAAGQVLEAAIINADSVDRRKIREALYNLDVHVAIGRFRVDQFGVPIKHRPLIVQWLNGKKRIVWPEEHRTTEPIIK